jgi:hypothetical protein
MINEKLSVFIEGIHTLKSTTSCGNSRAIIFPHLENVILLYLDNLDESFKDFMDTNLDEKQNELLQSLILEINELQKGLNKALEILRDENLSME